MPPDLVCLSHLRWDFVYQRPQHLMSRFARDRRVLFVEEPLFFDRREPGDGSRPARLDVSERPGGVRVAVPRLPHGLSPEEVEAAQRDLLQGLLAEQGIADYVLWYYTPMALGFSEGLAPAAVVYDCMDELSLFRGAPPELLERERRLLEVADLVFTGGQSLYEAEARPPLRRARLPEQHRRRALRTRAAARPRARRPGRDPAPAPRLLRGDRRADRPRPAGRGGRTRGPTGSG